MCWMDGQGADIYDIYIRNLRKKCVWDPLYIFGVYIYQNL